MTKTDTVTVELLAGRHPYGRAGHVCEYPAAEAAAHAELGLVRIVGADEPGEDEPDADQAAEPDEKPRPKRKPAKKKAS